MFLRSKVATDFFQAHLYVLQLLELMAASILGHLDHDRCRDFISPQVWASLLAAPSTLCFSPHDAVTVHCDVVFLSGSHSTVSWQDCVCLVHSSVSPIDLASVWCSRNICGGDRWISKSIIVSFDARDTIISRNPAFIQGLFSSLSVH